MPSRWACGAIVGFWLATMAWFVQREIWPHYAPNSAPRVVIELSDEAVRQSLPVRWRLYRNGQFLTPARTNTEYIEKDDSFLLVCTIFKFEAFRIPSIVVTQSRSTYRITRGGSVVAQQSETDVSFESHRIKVFIAAEIHDGWVSPNLRIESPWGNFEPESERVRIRGASVLNPLHPVNRLSDVRAGQRWRMPEVDPMTQAIRVALQSATRHLGPIAAALPDLSGTSGAELLAEVVGPRPCEWNGDQHECFVIEYRSGGELRATTWVRAADGLVLQQQASLAGDEVTLIRD